MSRTARIIKWAAVPVALLASGSIVAQTSYRLIPRPR